MDFSQTMPIRDAEVRLRPHLADHNDPASSSDEDGNTTELELGRIWAYPCKHPSCPCYDKMHSNFLNHLKDFTLHRENEVTKSRAGRRQCAREWRYETSLEKPKRLPPLFESNNEVWHYGYRSADGKMRSCQGTSAEITTLKNIQSARAQHDSTTLNEPEEVQPKNEA